MDYNNSRNKKKTVLKFMAFLRTGNPDDEPPLGWAPPEGPISAYADFWKIVPESD